MPNPAIKHVRARRTAHLLFVGMVLVSVGCETVPTVPEPVPGQLSLALAMPQQALLVDRIGNHLRIERLGIALGEPMIVAGAVDTLRCATGRCVRPTEGGAVRMTLGPGDRAAWATFSADSVRRLGSGPYALVVRLAPAPEAEPGTLLAGSSVTVGGIYNGIVADQPQYYGVFVAGFAWTDAVVLPLPPLDLATHGGRLRLVLDPGPWFLDPVTDAMAPIPALAGHLTMPGNVPGDVIRARVRSALRLEVE